MNQQFNHVTGNVYQGRNQVELQKAKAKHNYKSDEWLTFVQAREKGLTLIGAKGRGVEIFKGFIEVSEKDDKGEYKTKSRPAGFARVFNMDLTRHLTKDNKGV